MPEASLVLLPTQNERENLPRVLGRLSRVPSVDVLVIDDASPDGTDEEAETLSTRFPRLSVLHRRRKEGLGPAYVQGIGEALQRGYRRIVTMDADLSHAPEDVPRLLEGLERADVAVGSRHVEGGGVVDWPVARRALSRMGSLYARTLLGLPVRDMTSGFRAYRTDALAELDLSRIRSRGCVFQIELLRRLLHLPGATALEVPILFRNRNEGDSKLTAGIIAEALLEVARLSLTAPASETRLRGPHRTAVELPACSVIVPIPPDVQAPLALRSIRELAYSRDRLEVLVSRGRAPSTQRNVASREATGDYLLFLDDDSQPGERLLEHYVESLSQDPRVGAVGGPSITKGTSPVEKACAALFSEPWVLGKSAARYGARGGRRFTDERELILCNLCVRREAFEEVGGFDEGLYPNEENELLDGLERRGWRLLYLPEAEVHRPQRKTVHEVLLSAFRYGAGRGAQAKGRWSRVSAARSLLAFGSLVGLGVSVGGLLWGRLELALPLLLYLTYLLALGAKLLLRSGPRSAGVGVLLAPLLHGGYAAGLAWGLLAPRRARDARVVVEKVPSP